MKRIIIIILIGSFINSYKAICQSSIGTDCYPSFSQDSYLHGSFGKVYLIPNINRKDEHCGVGQITHENKISWKYGFIEKSKKHQKKPNRRYRYILQETEIQFVDDKDSWKEVYKSNLIYSQPSSYGAAGDTYSLPVKKNKAYRLEIRYQFKGKLGVVWSTPKVIHSKPFVIKDYLQNQSMDEFVNFNLTIHQESGGEYHATVNHNKFWPAGLYFYWSVCEVEEPNSWDCISGTLIENPEEWWNWQHQFQGYQGNNQLSPSIVSITGKKFKEEGKFKAGKMYMIKHGIYGENQSWIERKKMFTSNGIIKTDH